MGIALNRTTGAEFEAFAISFWAALVGAQFVPMGGLHDGGADGFFQDSPWEHPTRSEVFMQASIDKRPTVKIRHTIHRLRDFGRIPRQLIYITNQTIPNVDLVEERLSNALDVFVEIRDQKFITAHVTVDTRAAASYYQHLHHRTEFLLGARRSALGRSDHISEPYVYTYLVEAIDRNPQSSFADGVVDAMIVFALEGTDPNLDIKMNEEEIRDKILQHLPSAQLLIRERLRDRLEAISRRPNRRIRWHMQEDKWVLPYEERRILDQVVLEDVLLRYTARRDLVEEFAAITLPPNLDPDFLARLTLDVLQLACEQDGLRFAKFVSDPTPDDSIQFISDATKQVLTRHSLERESHIQMALAIDDVLRKALYNSTPALRKWLHSVSRAYSILFVLQGEPRVLRYFDNVLSKTVLYVGADILITALSERYVQPTDQHTRILLKAASAAGAQLMLAAPVLEEVRGHLRSSDREYRDFIEPLHHVDYETARHDPFILVRAYLYTQIFATQNGPSSWEDFISQFCEYRDLHKDASLTQIRRYLMLEFGMNFENWERIQSASNPERHKRLLSSILPLKTSEFLASNDALVFELVTNRRTADGEISNAPEFGYQAWWLSAGEGAAVKAMSRVDRSDPQILMRPSYLAKTILLAPSAVQARQNMQEFLPSLLGMRLARRVTDSTFHRLVGRVNAAESLEPSRRGAKIADMVDQFKSVRVKEFDDSYALRGTGSAGIDDLYSPP